MPNGTQNTFQQLLEQFQAKGEEARTANIKRYEQAMAIYDEIIKRYQPGGPFQEAALGQLRVQKVADVGAGAQRLISGGLFGTEAGAGLETGWEQVVGAPARLKLEDIMMQRLTQAQVGKAGFIERREDEYPDYGALMQAGMAVGGYGAGGAAPRTVSRTIDYGKPLTGGGGFGGRTAAPVTPATQERGYGVGPAGAPIEMPPMTVAPGLEEYVRAGGGYLGKDPTPSQRAGNIRLQQEWARKYQKK